MPFKISTLNANHLRHLMCVVLCFLLVGCQSAFKLIPKSAPDVLSQAELDAIIKNGNTNITHKKNPVFLQCTGLFHCDIAAIDTHLIINMSTGKPYRKAFKHNRVYVHKSTDERLQYVGLTDKGRHDLLVRLFPVSRNAYELIMISHDLKENASYRIHGFRKRMVDYQDGSLLALAVPKPVCVVLLKQTKSESEKPIRQFCKFTDITTGLGEFKEEAVSFKLTQPKNNQSISLKEIQTLFSNLKSSR